MWGSRLIRRRWFLAVVFGFSLVYFLSSIYKQVLSPVEERFLVNEKLESGSFQWHAQHPQNPADSGNFTLNITGVNNCRNSVQGQVLIADDEGYVCKRKDVKGSGCCSLSAATTKRYVCDSCTKNGCCEVYEHCVSCCLLPEKQPLLRNILSRASDSFRHLFASVADHFELCLAKCRTSSQSVQHENSYRDPKLKYCYGEALPDLQAAPVKK
ncbi:hypothetical protein CAPTEDRAFT_93600 [Capitella teleta]|uniref:SREBP regulating gene protein n=1 Tax=Capitella teleta TaxID=283909 RepID=R7UDA5_CAPTE|nr:hypothetical protein CAPTEDRAFT_93600 [Capitella teleta]|eukprot:ELU04086.1 hypothetical protein CAPTEDRAFT_93600 [Capitella teleta]